MRLARARHQQRHDTGRVVDVVLVQGEREAGETGRRQVGEADKQAAKPSMGKLPRQRLSLALDGDVSAAHGGDVATCRKPSYESLTKCSVDRCGMSEMSTRCSRPLRVSTSANVRGLPTICDHVASTQERPIIIMPVSSCADQNAVDTTLQVAPAPPP